MTAGADRRKRPAHSCAECETSAVPLLAFEAHDAQDRRPCVVRLCAACLRDRGAAWRWRWKITGRELPDARKAA